MALPGRESGNGSAMNKFVLGPNHEVVVEPDLLRWGRFLEDGHRIVAQEYVGEYYVSTIFVGLEGQIFETMVFRKNHPSDSLAQVRCSTWQEAEAQHAKLVAEIKLAKDKRKQMNTDSQW